MEQDNHPSTPPEKPLLTYALFYCDPALEPPFYMELGFNNVSFRRIEDCAHIPDAIEKLDAFCQSEKVTRSPGFTLLYPIYMDAMGTEHEDAMHNIAWLIKEQADKNQWNFARVDGHSGKSQLDFIL